MDHGKPDHVLVITSLAGELDQDRTERGLREILAGGVVHAVPAGVLKANMDSFLRQVSQVLAAGVEPVGGFVIDSVEVAAQISGDGQVCLVGSGVKVAAGGQLKFVLKRAPAG